MKYISKKVKFVIALLLLFLIGTFFYFFTIQKLNIEKVQGFELNEEKICDCGKGCSEDDFAYKNPVLENRFVFNKNINSCADLLINNVQYDIVNDKLNLTVYLANKTSIKNLCKCEEIRKLTITKNNEYFKNLEFGDIEVYYKEVYKNKLVFKSIFDLRNRP